MNENKIYKAPAIKIFLLLLVCFLFSREGKAQVISCGSPFANFGLPVTFCGVVKGSSRDSIGKNSGTLLYMCGNYPYQGMTIVIKDLEMPMFDYTLEEWIGKNICVTGIVQTYKGKPYIEVKKKWKLIID